MADAPGASLRGTTRIAGVIGDPVRHSRSPALVNAAFAAAGLDWAYAAFEVAAGDGPAAVAAMRSLQLGGLSVTMPHKHDVIAALDGLSPSASVLGAVNCIAWDGGDLVGHNTDGAGLVASLATDHDIDLAGRRCLVLGAGGAARAVVHALAGASGEQVTVVNRTPARAEAAAALAGARGRVGDERDVSSADVVVNATSIGMGASPGADGPTPVAIDALGPGQVVVDLVYQPLDTPLLAGARQRGAVAIDGLGMLVHQAALAIALWTGVEPDIDVMAEAARA